MSNKNLYKLIVIFVVGIVCYIFWQFLLERFFDVDYPPEVTYEQVDIKYTPEEVKKVLGNE